MTVGEFDFLPPAATFSVVSQSVALNCFPAVEIVKTSGDISGQVYLPAVSWSLMVCSIAVTAGFQTTSKIGNAFGAPPLPSLEAVLWQCGSSLLCNITGDSYNLESIQQSI